MKEDRQPRNRPLLLFHLSPAILPIYECSRSILCKPQESPHCPLTRLGVIISYPLHLERKITSPLTSIILPYVYSESSDEQYGAYTPSPATKTTSAIIKVKTDKSLQFQVNRLSIARDTTIKARPKKSSQNLNFSFLP